MKGIVLILVSLTVFFFSADLLWTLSLRLDDDACSTFAPRRAQQEDTYGTNLYSLVPPGIHCTYELPSGEILEVAPKWSHTFSSLIGLILSAGSVIGVWAGLKRMRIRDSTMDASSG